MVPAPHLTIPTQLLSSDFSGHRQYELFCLNFSIERWIRVYNHSARKNVALDIVKKKKKPHPYARKYQESCWISEFLHHILFSCFIPQNFSVYSLLYLQTIFSFWLIFYVECCRLFNKLINICSFRQFLMLKNKCHLWVISCFPGIEREADVHLFRRFRQTCQRSPWYPRPGWFIWETAKPGVANFVT